MRPKQQPRSVQDDLFRSGLEQWLNQRHPLYRLAGQIDWSVFEEHFSGLYAETGRPGLPIRLMVGLHYLKHLYNESDESIVERWVENPYWQYFCGEEYLQHSAPIDASQMTRFRTRIGESGCELLLQMSVVLGLKTGALSRTSLAAVNVDTTVQEKAISFPTDAKLYHRARESVVKLAQKVGIGLRQSYVRLSKHALAQTGRYFHAKQVRRAKREVKRLRTYLGRVIRDVERKINTVTDSSEQAVIQSKTKLVQLLALAKHIQTQKRNDKNKIYSVHAPEVECISKGKAHRRYEFGVKVGVVSTNKDNFVVGMKSFPGNPYDGHTLVDMLAQMNRLTGVVPKEAYVDRGYRGHDVGDGTQVWIAGQRRISVAVKKKLKRRNAIEPVIGHLKSDGRLGRNFLKGTLGDALNALLCASGHNLRKILRWLALFCAYFCQLLCDIGQRKFTLLHPLFEK